MNLIHIEPQLNRVTIDGEKYRIEGNIDHVADCHPTEIDEGDPAINTVEEPFPDHIMNLPYQRLRRVFSHEQIEWLKIYVLTDKGIEWLSRAFTDNEGSINWNPTPEESKKAADLAKARRTPEEMEHARKANFTKAQKDLLASIPFPKLEHERKLFVDALLSADLGTPEPLRIRNAEMPSRPETLTDAEADRVRLAHRCLLSGLDERPIGGINYGKRVRLLNGMIARLEIDFSEANCDFWEIKVQAKNGNRFTLKCTFLSSAGLLSSFKGTDYRGVSPRPMSVNRRLMLATYSDTGAAVDADGNAPDPKDALLVHVKMDADYQTVPKTHSQSGGTQTRTDNKWPKLNSTQIINALKIYDGWHATEQGRGIAKPQFKDCWATCEQELKKWKVESYAHLERLVKSRRQAKANMKKAKDLDKRKANRLADPTTD